MRVAVIGAGIGGLVTTLLLAQAGADVTVLEAGAGPGGKLHQVRVGESLIDGGPTVFTMRPVFEAIFAAVGARLDEHLQLEKLDVLARHGWQDGSRLELFADTARNEQEISRFAGAKAARGYADFSKQAKQIFELLDGSFMQVPQPGLLGLMKNAGPRVAKISPFATLWDELKKYFDDPRLRQLFGRYATYCGSSPFEAPATLMLIAHAELLGVWKLAGGMIRLAEVLAGLATARGAKFCYGARVIDLDVAGGRVVGVRTADQKIAVDAVVANADLAAIDAGLLGASAKAAVAGMTRGAKRSLSAVTWAMTGTSDGFELAHHNVFFAQDYAEEFSAIAQGRICERPTVYVCAPDGGAGMFCLINAPANGQAAGEDALAKTLGQLERCGLRLAPDAIVRTDAAGWEQKFPGTGGAIYGRALAGWKDSFDRPGAKTKLRGFYLAGGSVHPGPGLPMAALSGKVAARCVLTGR